MKKLLLLFYCIILCACSQKDCCAVREASITFSVVDKDGNDLLDPNLPDSIQNPININNLRMIDIVDGKEKQKIYSEGNAFRLSDPQPLGSIFKYYIGTGVNIEDKGKITKMNIKWSETDIDEIKAEIDRGDNYKICIRVWVNDELVFDAPNRISHVSGTCHFELVKYQDKGLHV